MAKLTAVYGPMFAGKTTWLLQRIQELESRNQKCLVFKPRLDDRYGKEAKLHSHSGLTGSAILVDEHNPHEMLGIWAEHNEQHSVVIIDEAMFFAPTIVEVVKEMMARDLEVIVAGLDTNYRKEPFEPMPKLIKMSEDRQILQAMCYKCGKPARFSARIKGGEGSIVVGGKDSYQPACEDCHTVYQDEENMTPRIQFPLTRVRSGGKQIRIEVMADSMRVGKTTAVKVIAEGLRQMGKTVTESYEDWQNNPYLKQSYEDPAKNFLESQKWFIKRKFEQVRDGGKEIFIQDVCPEMDYCYAETNRRLGRMSDTDFANYQAYYYSLDWSLAPAPDVLIYLQVSDEVLIQRAMDSRREFETVENEYFLMMKKVNREWLQGITNQKFPACAGRSNSQMNILTVDTDKLDFAHDQKAKNRLAELVIAKVGPF